MEFDMEREGDRMMEPLQEDRYENLPVEYDQSGLMKYHPFYHPNHRKPFTQIEIEYLCKYIEIDGVELISYALGRTPKSIIKKHLKLKKDGNFDYYKNLNKYWV